MANQSGSGEFDYDSCNEFVPGAGADWCGNNSGSGEYAPVVRTGRPDYGCLAQSSPRSSNGSPLMVPAQIMMRRSSSGSGEFALSSPMLPIQGQHSPNHTPVNYGYPPQMHQMQGQPCVPPEVIQSIKQEAQSKAHSALEHEKAQCHRQVHLARVRIAELEECVKRSDAENDDMLTKLTVLELENQAVKKDVSAMKNASKSTTGDEAQEKIKSLEAELEKGSDAIKELEGMKKIVMVLAGELKRRMAEVDGKNTEGEETNRDDVAHVEEHLHWLSSTGKIPAPHDRQHFPSEDTDYADSRDHSDDSD